MSERDTWSDNSIIESSFVEVERNYPITVASVDESCSYSTCPENSNKTTTDNSCEEGSLAQDESKDRRKKHEKRQFTRSLANIYLQQTLSNGECLTPVQTSKRLDDTSSPLKYSQGIFHSTQIDNMLETPSSPVNRDVSHIFKSYRQQLEDSMDDEIAHSQSKTESKKSVTTKNEEIIMVSDDSDSDSEIRPTPGRKNRHILSDSNESYQLITSDDDSSILVKTPRRRNIKVLHDSDSETSLQQTAGTSCESHHSPKENMSSFNYKNNNNDSSGHKMTEPNKISLDSPITSHVTGGSPVLSISTSDDDANDDGDGENCTIMVGSDDSDYQPSDPDRLSKAYGKQENKISLPEDFNKKVDNSSESRKFEIQAELLRLQCEKTALEIQLESIKGTLKSMNPHNVPDGGYKLTNTAKNIAESLRSINSKIEHLNKLLGHKTIHASEAERMPRTEPSVALPSGSSQTTHSQQTVTLDALQKIHHTLASYKKKEVDDPKALKVTLLSHQKEGLGWMVWRETQKPSGGILADDMGLGKTLSMLSLILKCKEEHKDTQSSFSEDDSEDGSSQSRWGKNPLGGTLIVCPSSVMGQWELEIKNKIKPGHLTVLMYHGSKREKNPRRIARHDVVLTSYALIQKQHEDGPILSIKWNRVILDEAHIIRNHQSKTAQAIFKLRRKNSWALTGTPIHNKELDFFALIKFVKCKPFNDIAVWKKWVDNKNQSGIERLNVITKSVMLRRTKADLQKAGELKALKSKKFSVVKVKLDPNEHNVYEKVATFSRAVFASYLQQRAEKEDLLSKGIPVTQARRQLMNVRVEDNPFKNHPELALLHKNMLTMSDKIQSHEILVLLLRLRQICCHPGLASSILDKVEVDENGGIDGEDNNEIVQRIMNMSMKDDEESTTYEKTLTSEDPVFDKSKASSKIRAVIECLLEIYVSTEDEKIIVVSQWSSALDIIESVLKEQGIPTLSLTGKILVKDRMPIIEKFNSKDMTQRVLLLSLTAGGTGLNLIGANHLLLVDIHWNPQLEAQASDRIYRVGQTKDVYIYKFICLDTIEERIEELQLKKLELARSVLTGSMQAQSSKLSMNDLKHLFNVK